MRNFIGNQVKWIVLSVFMLCVCGLSHADRRPPTQEEYQKFMPTVQLWLGANWESVKDYGHGEYIKQRITSVEYCCIDKVEDKHLHIIDIKFHAKFYEHDVLMEEKDMSQRILFKCKGDRVVDFDPMPAYKLEEIT